jgi:hypothetical protein
VDVERGQKIRQFDRRPHSKTASFRDRSKSGESVELKVEAGRLVIERTRGRPRSGWAEDARRLAETRDDEVTKASNGEARRGLARVARSTIGPEIKKHGLA